MILYKTDERILDDRLYVIAGECALTRNGLTTGNPQYLNVFTKYKQFHNKDLGAARFIYNPKEDNVTDYVTPLPNNKNILLPTKERAIVESIIHIDGCDEGVLLEAINTYLAYFGTKEELIPVANCFNLSIEQLEYWIQEAKEYASEN